MPEDTPSRLLADDRRFLVGAAVLVVAVAVTFGGVLEHGWVAWDDPLHVWLNPVVTDWHQVGWYRRLMTPSLGYPAPVPIGTYAVVWELFGTASAPVVHGISVALHAANALLVVVLVRHWIDSREVGLAAGFLWALHPVVTESVAWASNLKGLQMTLCLLVALVAWERVIDARPGRRWWTALVAALAVGLWTKPTFVVLAPLATHRWWFHRPARDDASLRGTLGGIWVICTGWVFYLGTSYANYLGEGAAKFEARSTVTTVFKGLGLQVRNYLYPFDLQPYYPFDLVEFGPLAWLGFVAALAVVAALIWTHATRRVAAFPLTFAAITYLPYSNLRPLPRFTADTYAYVPSIGLAAVVALGVDAARRQVERRGGRPWSAVALVAVLAVGWAALAGAQTRRWRSTEALFEPLLDQPRQFALPHTLVAYEEYRAGDFDRAVDLLDEAWPRLAHSRELPRFAPKAYLKAGRDRRAAEARLRVADIDGRGAADWVRALEFLVRHRLPVPSGDAGELFERAVREWRRSPREMRSLSTSRVERYLRDRRPE